MIRIVDYGVGNMQAFINLFKRMGIEAATATIPEDLKDAKRLILPGVGHFDNAMQRLNNSGLRTDLERLVLVDSVPVIGICIGMHMLAEHSDEGAMPGLGWVPGRVKSFASNPRITGLPIPHMGWNTLTTESETCILQRGFNDKTQFYFLHSYYFDAEDEKDVAASTHYGVDFDVIVSRGHIHGVQFHPEKSHYWGMHLLKNFAEFC